jgi:hypothetical protein
MPRTSSRRRVTDDDDDDDENTDRKVVKTQNDSDDDEEVVMFSSQIPELSQDILPVKDAERSNLLKMTEVARDRACNDTTRLVLFKALAGEPINRSNCAQEAGISGDQRVSTAVFEEVSIRLKNAFDFELKRIPSWMEKMKALPKKYKDRYYLINALEDDGAGHHSKAIHNIHEDATVEKGLLMVILSLAYCKGTPRNDGSRWILDKDLYSFLNRIDENIANEPPAQGTKRRMPSQSSRFNGGDGVAMTPDVDFLLDKFVGRDYLLKEKATEERLAASQDAEEGSMFYTMGPRAAMEIGRRQIIYFAAEVLDEEPDPTMLAELETDPEEGGTQGTQ